MQVIDASKKVSDLAYNIATTLAYNEAMARYQQESETLEDYNRNRSKDSQINIPLIENFMNDQIQKAGLNPKNFHYYIGSNWLVFPLEKINTYGFIIPGDDPSLVSRVMGISDELPAHILNIIRLNKFLRPEYHELDPVFYDQFRLQVIKTLVEAKFEGVLSEVAASKLDSIKPYIVDTAIDNAISIALSTLSGYIQSVSVFFGYAVSGSSSVYGQAASAQKKGLLQMEIADYVIKSRDIGLVKAYIEDLSKQLEAEEQGFIASRLRFFKPYMPSSLQWGKSGYTAKLLNLLESFKEKLEKKYRNNNNG